MNAASADRPDPTEAMVALTDLAIGIECVGLAALVASDRLPARAGLREPLFAFLVATASASLTGAALHGLTTDHADPRRRALWRWSLASIGIGGLSSWWLGARIALRPREARVVAGGASLVHIPYLLHVVSGDRPFRVAIASYVPGALSLGVALASRLGERPSRGPAIVGLTGLGVTRPRASSRRGSASAEPSITTRCSTRSRRSVSGCCSPPRAASVPAPEAADRRRQESRDAPRMR